MKKVYVRPSIKVTEISTESMICSSYEADPSKEIGNEDEGSWAKPRGIWDNMKEEPEE